MSITASPAAQETSESIKDTIESIVIAFVLAFVFRAYIVEAFIIPTGSMAPTLLGAHVRVACPQCGYRYDCDVPEGATEVISSDGRRREASYITAPNGLPAHCPMCGYSQVVPPHTFVNAGDRILVHKYIYSVSEPRRWDVVVFKAPHVERANTNYIKRLVGLPEEELFIIEGNIYTRSLAAAAPEAEKQWHIQRKSAREKVQRAVWQPIYHSQYVPLDADEPVEGNPHRRVPWRVPWVAVDHAEQWLFKDHFSYQYHGSAASEMRFDFGRQGIGPRYAYNQIRTRTPAFDQEPVEDIRLAATVEPAQAGLAIRLQTTARWEMREGGLPVPIVATINPSGSASIVLPSRVDPLTQKPVTLASGQLSPLAPGKAYTVELWFVDQEASLWLDGRMVLAARYDLPIEQIKSRPGLPWGFLPEVRLGVEGSPVTLHRVELDRDVYYSSSQGYGAIARGGLMKDSHGTRGEPVTIGSDQFFCMGDNSPLSSDSRYWGPADRWVQEFDFNGHDIEGIVPRQLMLGRAFFVYWPGMYGFSPTRQPLLVNFGDMRFIH